MNWKESKKERRRISRRRKIENGLIFLKFLSKYEIYSSGDISIEKFVNNIYAPIG